MILNLIMKLFQWVADLVMGFVQLPIFPAGVGEATALVFTWMSAGMGIIDFFCPLEQIAPAIAFFMTCYAVQKIYFFVIWIMKKIPALGIE